MDELAVLQSLGLELPGPGYVAGAILFGLVGLAAFRHGRSSGRRTTSWLGVALVLYPYVISNTGMLWAVGLLLCAGIWFDSR